MNGKIDKPVSEDTPLSQLYGHYKIYKKELIEIYRALGFKDPKLGILLKTSAELKKSHPRIYLYLVLYRLLHLKNVFWDRFWSFFRLKYRENSPAQRKLSVRVDLDLKDYKNSYLWVSKPLKSDILYLFNTEKLYGKATVNDALNSLVGILDKKRLIMFIKNGFGEAEILRDVFRDQKLDFFKILFPAYLIKDLIRSSKDVSSASISCPREISGTSGISKIIFQGSNVGTGISELNKRQEIDLSKLGTWTEMQSGDLYISVDGKLKFKDYTKIIEFIMKTDKELILSKV